MKEEPGAFFLEDPDTFLLFSLVLALLFLIKNFFNWFEREKHIGLLFHLLMHSLVDSCMCPDRRSNPHPWRIRTMLSPTELPGQGPFPPPDGSTLSSVSSNYLLPSFCKYGSQLMVRPRNLDLCVPTTNVS